MARTKAAKPSTDSGNDFPFIISHGPGTIKDPALRTLIRKQAMKEVGIARKRRGHHGRINTAQPDSINETDSPKEASATTSSSNDAATSEPASETPITSHLSVPAADPTEYDPEDLASWMMGLEDYQFSLPSPMSLSGYERVRNQYCVDLTQFTMLTNFNVSKSAIRFFAIDPTRLYRLMGSRQWSYIEYVPQRYDSSKCVAAATDCVLAKVASVLLPSSDGPRSVLPLYSKALSALQEAISDPSTNTTPEVLCAIELMSLHELLDPTRTDAYTHHIRGSARLVKHRGSKTFTSEFEKALFSGHVGPIVADSLMENTHCYLAQPQWSRLYMSLIEESEGLSERSRLVISGRKLMFFVSGLWHDVEEAVRSEDLFDDTILYTLEDRCRKLHAEFLAWLEEYKAHCVATSLASPSMTELGLRREIFGAALECLVIVKRLLASVCETERRKLEGEVQGIAKLMLEMQTQRSPCHSWLFQGHQTNIARTAIVSEEAWGRDLEDATVDERRLAARERYVAWAKSIRGNYVTKSSQE